VGAQDMLNFWGSSFVSDPYGRVLGLAPTDREVNLVVECDLSLIDQKKRDWPFMEARRIKYEQP
jgi:N-carbamoylputrescine amidase